VEDQNGKNTKDRYLFGMSLSGLSAVLNYTATAYPNPTSTKHTAKNLLFQGRDCGLDTTFSLLCPQTTAQRTARLDPSILSTPPF
jgi:hypothetical protein